VEQSAYGGQSSVDARDALMRGMPKVLTDLDDGVEEDVPMDEDDGGGGGGF